MITLYLYLIVCWLFAIGMGLAMKNDIKEQFDADFMDMFNCLEFIALGILFVLAPIWLPIVAGHIFFYKNYR